MPTYRPHEASGAPLRTATLLIGLLVLTGCNSYRVIPEDLEGKVNTQTPLREVSQHPSVHGGELVVWGGEVLEATRIKDATRLEVLQIPLNDDLVPAEGRGQSQGRFLAFDRQGEILDPAVVNQGTKVTIVGEVQQPVSMTSDAGSQQYPSVAIRDMTIWDRQTRRVWGIPYYYPFYGPYYGSYYYGSRPYTFWDGTRVRAARQ